jgi:hypothetical protein
VKNKKWKRAATSIALRVGREAIGAEVGTHDGAMSRELLKAIPRLTLYMVDRWKPYTDAERAEFPRSRIVQTTDEKKWKEIEDQANMVADPYDRAYILKGDSVHMADEVEDGSLDFVFIDSDHSYEGAKREMAAWIPKIREGGWLMGYDYGDGRDAAVTKAVAELGKPYKSVSGWIWTVQL